MPAQDLNTTAPPRPGEELDAVRLEAHLHANLPGAAGPVVIEQFPAGHSNLTYLVRMGDHEWVLRRPPFGTRVKTAHDMGREFRILSHLHSIYAPAPRPALYCEDPAVLGAPFYLMERRRGVVIRKELPAFLAANPTLATQLSYALVDNLATLHNLDLNAAGLAGFGKPEGYVRRQIEGWRQRWLDAQTEQIPEMTEVSDWLGAHMPHESGASLIHNDYKLDNIMLDPADPARIVAVLDWEMATVGDPLMDLGTSMSYWSEAGDPPEFQSLRFSPTVNAGFITRREFLDRYQQSSGRAVANPVYYYAYGLWKLAAILQQIYYRYFHGLTRDERFAGFGDVVKGLARQAAAAVEAGKL